METQSLACTTLLQEFKALHSKSIYDDQATVTFDENDPFKVTIVLIPNGGFYKDARIEFLMKLPFDYPLSKPTVSCKTFIYHPNINKTGEICLNILNSDWNANLRIADFINGLLFLFYHPNLESRLNSSVASTPSLYTMDVARSIQGGTIGVVKYPKIVVTKPTAANTKSPGNYKRVVVRDLVQFFEEWAKPMH